MWQLSPKSCRCGDEFRAVRDIGDRLYITNQAGAGFGIVSVILRKFRAAARWNLSFVPLGQRRRMHVKVTAPPFRSSG
jgi:hypothetical protein